MISLLSQPYGRKGADYPLGIFLIGINLVILICDLLEVNQLFHYSSFALLGIAAAGKFVWLVVAHPNAVSGETRRKVLDWFALGTACILFAFAVSDNPTVIVRSGLTYNVTLSGPADLECGEVRQRRLELPHSDERQTDFWPLCPLPSIYCDSLWPLKQQIGLPFALVLELHAYW